MPAKFAIHLPNSAQRKQIFEVRDSCFNFGISKKSGNKDSTVVLFHFVLNNIVI